MTDAATVPQTEPDISNPSTSKNPSAAHRHSAEPTRMKSRDL